MNAYLPSRFLQVALHERDGRPARLDKLLQVLRGLGFNPSVGIDLRAISKPGLLLLPTRQLRFPFEQEELCFVVGFVSQGNSLFHLSNHPPLTQQDTRLGELLGYRFHGVVRGFDPRQDFEVYPTPSTDGPFHSLDTDLHFSIRNSCMISYDNESCSVIADFSRSVLSCGDQSAAFWYRRPSQTGERSRCRTRGLRTPGKTCAQVSGAWPAGRAQYGAGKPYSSLAGESGSLSHGGRASHPTRPTAESPAGTCV